MERMRRGLSYLRFPRALAVLALAIAASCSSGGDSAPRRPVIQPEPVGNGQTTAVAVPATVNGAVEIRFTIAHPDSDPLDIEVQYSIDDVHWHAATLNAQDAVLGLSSSSDGIEYTVTWDSMDLGFRGQAGSVRVVPRDSIGRGVSVTASAQTTNTIRDRQARVGLSAGREANKAKLFLHLPDRIHEVSLCIK